MSSISVHLIERIAKTDNVWVKIALAMMVIAFITFGVNNITKEIADFYESDLLTNFKSVAMKNFTFPTIGKCTKRIFTKVIFLNGSLVKAEFTFNDSTKDLIDKGYGHFERLIARLNPSEL